MPAPDDAADSPPVVHMKMLECAGEGFLCYTTGQARGRKRNARAWKGKPVVGSGVGGVGR